MIVLVSNLVVAGQRVRSSHWNLTQTATHWPKIDVGNHCIQQRRRESYRPRTTNADIIVFLHYLLFITILPQLNYFRVVW